MISAVIETQGFEYGNEVVINKDCPLLNSEKTTFIFKVTNLDVNKIENINSIEEKFTKKKVRCISI